MVEKEERVCLGCQNKFKPNHKLKGRQKTCGKQECRRKHRCFYQRRWRKLNQSVEQEYQAKRKSGREKDFWKEYRRLHPEYECRNRKLSRLRKRLKREGLQRKLDIVQVIENAKKLHSLNEFATRHRSFVLELNGIKPEQRGKAHADTGTSSLHFGKRMGARRIAKILKINRKSVRLVLSKRAVSLVAERRKRGSIIDPYKSHIAEFLEKVPDIPTHTILMRMREKGYSGGYTVLREWVKTQRVFAQRPREAFLSLEFAPGECAQVDWGEFGDVFSNGVKVHCFLITLCYSRLLYIEFTRSEKFEEFIRCHENAFQFFGGVPQECWYDNLRSAVVERMGSLIRFNSRFLAYMGHHGIKPHACNPARGNEKGRVESGVKFVRSSFWPGRQFKDFEDLQDQGRTWLRDIANKREHGATHKIPILHFERDERCALRPMNPYRYDTDEVFTRVVPPTFHVLYDTNKYSVPWTLVGMSVTIRVSDQFIKVFYNEKFVTQHERQYKKLRTISKPEHSTGLLERKPGATRTTWQLSAIKGMGEDIAKYVDLLRSGSRSLRSEVAKLLALTTIYGEGAVNSAVSELLKLGIVGVENLELALKNSATHQEALNPRPMNFQNSKLNRVVPTVDLRRFDALLFKSAADEPKDASENLGDVHGNHESTRNDESTS
jgi:transposase